MIARGSSNNIVVSALRILCVLQLLSLLTPTTSFGIVSGSTTTTTNLNKFKSQQEQQQQQDLSKGGLFWNNWRAGGGCIVHNRSSFHKATTKLNMNPPSSSADAETSSSWIEGSKDDATRALKELEISPLDEYNVKLLNEVHHKSYANPMKEVEEYDLVVIGAGAGGLVSSRQAARRGAKSAMISEKLAGGDCLNVGCVPSKSLLKCARQLRDIRKTCKEENDTGITVKDVDVDFDQIMKRMRKLRAAIAPIDGHDRGTSLGVDVFQGRGRFVDENMIEVLPREKPNDDDEDEKKPILLKFKKAVIATGGRPSVPMMRSSTPIPGLDAAPYVTNEQLFNLEELPPRMVVFGAGVIALEMAQAFATFGSKVTVLARSKILSNGDREAADLMQKIMEEEDNIKFLEGVDVQEVKTLREGTEGGEESSSSSLPLMKLSIKSAQDSDTVTEIECECLLVATGRLPNVQNLNLEKANVKYDEKKGILINDLAQSISNPKVYAVGDCVANVPRLTHMSGEMAKVVVQNALFKDSWKVSSLVVPACMYTEPEYATVGQVKFNDSDNKRSLDGEKKKGDEVDTYTTSLEHNDRAILDGDSNHGLVKIYCEKGTDTIVGCTIVAPRAGEMINEVSLAMKYGIGLGQIGRNIHCYPTTGEAIMMCGLQFINARWKRLD